MEADEAAAVEQARAGDPEAFRVLVELHSRAIFRLAYRMTGNEQDAEDTVQEAFLRAWRQIGRFDARSRLSTWLYSIAVNCALDLLRARRRRKAEEPAEPQELADRPGHCPSAERLILSREAGRQVVTALEQLSPIERAAFVLRHWEGVTIEEISCVLGRSDGAARHTVFRAVQKLRRTLAPLVSTS